MQCICVVGMHRSGTSCLTGIMQRFGVELGVVFTENPFNRRGNRENADIMDLNNDVLAHNGGAWDLPIVVTKWTDFHLQRRDEIIATIACEAKSFWGFKDPRTLMTLPFWLDAGLEPLFIGTFRHPMRVALSLQARNNMTLEEGMQLWLAYNRRLLALWTKKPFPIVNFDLPSDQYLAMATNKLVGLLGIEESENAGYAQAFFTEDLRAQTAVPVDTGMLPAEVRVLYEQLRACSESE